MMKMSPFQSRRVNTRGFTLIELLIVITIIAILASIAFPVTGAVQRAAKRAAAGADISSIVTAVKGYYLEYGRYPVDVHGTADFLNQEVGGDFMLCLLGEDDPNGTGFSNPREINFIDPKLTEKLRNGYNEAVGNGGVYFDPFGNAYVVSIDATYDNKLKDPEAGGADLRKDILVWSFGPEAAVGTTGDLSTGYNKSIMSWK